MAKKRKMPDWAAINESLKEWDKIDPKGVAAFERSYAAWKDSPIGKLFRTKGELVIPVRRRKKF